jgi:hypothetical protein
MTQGSAPATEAARRFWASHGGDATTPEKLALGAESVFAQLQTGLARWVGAEGVHALTGRALELAQAAHPPLGAFSDAAVNRQVVEAAARAHGAGEVATSLITVIATLIDLLGRVVGEEMAVKMVEQTGAPRPHAASSSPGQGGRHG